MLIQCKFALNISHYNVTLAIYADWTYKFYIINNCFILDENDTNSKCDQILPGLKKLWATLEEFVKNGIIYLQNSLFDLNIPYCKDNIISRAYSPIRCSRFGRKLL